MLKTKIKRIITIALTVIVLVQHSVVAFAQENTSFAFALDTEASKPTILRSAELIPHRPVEFVVKKPTGKIVVIDATSNASGIAITEFPADHTNDAGDYQVNIRYPSMNYLGKSNIFSVSAGAASVRNSQVVVKETVINTGDSAELRVLLKDEFSNPVSGNLIGLRSDSGLIDSTAITNNTGEANFKFSSESAGLVNLQVRDLSSDLIVEDDLTMLFVDKELGLFSSPLARLSNAGNSAGPIDNFEFVDLPSEFNPGEQYSVTIEAVDAAGEVVSNYTGSIGFVVTNGNESSAEIPLTYDFTVEDQGSHTFSLGFRFKEIGSYEIRVADLNDTSVSNSYVFDVRTPGDSSPVASSSGLAITSPSTGKISSSTIVIAGQAEPGSAVKIFKDDVEIHDLVVGISGEFSYTTGVLDDGVHTFYLATVNEVGTIVENSDPVAVTVDTQGAELYNVLIEPDGQLDPGEVFKIKVFVSDVLDTAQVMLSGNLYPLEKNAEGAYEASIAAPIEFGTYDLDIVLVDELGNQEKTSAAASISVGQAPPAPDPVAPGPVTDIVATPEDGRVILEWTPAVPGDNPIVRYRVHYGTNSQLSNAVDTFTTEPTWYISGLDNGTLYYFSILAVDENGLTRDNFSHIAAATPTPPVVDVVDPAILMGAAGGEALAELEEDVSDSGPGVMGLLGFSLLAGFGVSRQKRKNC